MFVQLPNGNDGFPADVGVLQYHGIRGSKLGLDAVVSGLFGVSSRPSPEVALRRVEKTKFGKYLEGVRSRPGIRFIPFAVTEIVGHGGHATAFLTELAKQAAASKEMRVGKLLATGRRKVSLAVYLAHADTVLRGFPPPQTVWRPPLPRLGCLLLPRCSSPAPWAARVPVLPGAAREVPLGASTCCINGTTFEFP
jgi:hypothetical protein